MSNKEKIWIDMTDLSSWQGHFTGIQRVVYNIAKGYHESNKASFFTFDPKSKQFYKFNFTAFIEIIETAQGAQDSTTTSKKAVLISKAKQAYLRAPAPIKGLITPARLKKVAKKGYGQYQRVTRISNLFNSKQIEPLTFTDGQTILILGNTWDRPSLLTILGGIRRSSDIKIFQVVYDLIPVFQPQAFNEELFNIYTKNMFEVATISDGLMAISESSKRDMIRFCSELKIKTPPISVIRLGDDIPVSNDPIAPHGFSESDPFVISVGTIEARKNHALLYYAWKEGIRKGLDMPKLVIVGRRGWYTEDIVHTIKTDPETANLIVILDNVSDSELVWLYQKCLFTVYPSYYEGWGLPVAESLAMGKICLTSNVSSMPEVGGSLCLYHSPFNSQECLDGVAVLLEKSKRQQMEKRIKAEYYPTSWQDTFKQVEGSIESTTL